MERQEIIDWILEADSNKLAKGWSSKCDAFYYESDGFLVYLMKDVDYYVTEYIGKDTRELNDIVDFCHAELLLEDSPKIDDSDYYYAKIQHYEEDLLQHGYVVLGSDTKRIGSISIYQRNECIVCIVGDELTLNISINYFKDSNEFQIWFNQTEVSH